MQSFYHLIKLQLYKTLISIRFVVSMQLVLFFLLMELMSIKKMAMHFNQTINYSIVTFVLSNHFFLLMLFLAVFLIFSTLPHNDEQQMQLILRTGKMKWLLSYPITIIITAMVIMCLLIIFIFLVLNRSLDFSNNWGKILGTLGQQPHFGDAFGVEYQYSYYIQINIQPWEGFVRTVGLGCAVIGLVGCLMFIANLVLNGLGTIVGGCMIFIHMLSAYILEHGFYYISPISWISLLTSNIEKASVLPSLQYIVAYIICGYSGCLLLLVYFSRIRSKLRVF